MTKEIDNGFKDEGQPPRRFWLKRTKDETGISRTGRVLEGVLLQSGKVIAEWRPPMCSIGIYNSLDEFLNIHVRCHPSCSEVVWLDPAEMTDPCTGQHFVQRPDGTWVIGWNEEAHYPGEGSVVGTTLGENAEGAAG